MLSTPEILLYLYAIEPLGLEYIERKKSWKVIRSETVKTQAGAATRLMRSDITPRHIQPPFVRGNTRPYATSNGADDISADQQPGRGQHLRSKLG